jgi:hypothetical protein
MVIFSDGVLVSLPVFFDLSAYRRLRDGYDKILILILTGMKRYVYMSCPVLSPLPYCAISTMYTSTLLPFPPLSTNHPHKQMKLPFTNPKSAHTPSHPVPAHPSQPSPSHSYCSTQTPHPLPPCAPRTNTPPANPACLRHLYQSPQPPDLPSPPQP